MWRSWWNGDYDLNVIFYMYSRKLPIFSNLEKSLNQLKIDANKIKIEFATEENKKREEFYKAKSFANNVKVDSSKLITPNENLEDEIHTKSEGQEHND